MLSDPARRWLVRLARAALLLAPTAFSFALDGWLRGASLPVGEPDERDSYLVSLLWSGLVWSLLLAGAGSASRGRWLSRVLFALVFPLALGSQAYLFGRYHGYLGRTSAEFAANFIDTGLVLLRGALGEVARAVLPMLAGALLVLWAVARMPPLRQGALWVLLGPLALAAAIWEQPFRPWPMAAAPDALYLASAGTILANQFGSGPNPGLLTPGARRSLPVPALAPAPHPARDVLFIILESARTDAVCLAYDPACRRTEATNRLFPERIPFTQMRAVDSNTATSLSVLWSGLPSSAPREQTHSAPLLFDYARAAGFDTAYWTSQNLLFGNAGLWSDGLAARLRLGAGDVEPDADMLKGADEQLLADRVIAELPRLREPFFAVLQLANTHFPYQFDAARPMLGKADNPEPRYSPRWLYQEALYQQDLELARILSALRKSDAGRRTVIVYTSDHGEAFGEHGTTLHGSSVYDEELRVPAWVDAPPGTLGAGEEAALRARRDRPLFHVDLVPTLLDLLGLGGEPKLAPFRARMPGHSLLGPPEDEPPQLLDNCTGLWGCALENWGAMEGQTKLISRASDPGWRCFDVSRDPGERSPLPLDAPACSRLSTLANAAFGGPASAHAAR